MTEATTGAVADKSQKDDFIRRMPKVELHLHLEGTLEPDLLLRLAKKHAVALDYDTIEQVQQAYNFTSLDDFLKLYYQGMEVLVDQQDFYDLAWSYLERVATKDNVRHAEVFFDPQPHMQRGVSFETVVTGFHSALQQAHEQFNLTSKLIMCFVRHLPVEHMMETLGASLPFRHMIAAVGLDSSEKDNPPTKYKQLFARAREYGYDCVAHAGEEGPPSYIAGSLDDLQVRRIDHGVRATEDPELVQRLAKERVPLTVCPVSNCKLCVFPSMQEHNIKQMLDAGVCVTINSDDPAYFGAYITDNFLAVANEPKLKVTHKDVVRMVQNSIDATMLTQERKDLLLDELREFCERNPVDE